MQGEPDVVSDGRATLGWGPVGVASGGWVKSEKTAASLLLQCGTLDGLLAAAADAASGLSAPIRSKLRPVGGSSRRSTSTPEGKGVAG